MSSTLPPPTPGSGEPFNQLAPPDPAQAPHLMAFFSASGADLALAESQFTQQEFISRIIDHVRHPNPKVSQGGIRLLYGYLRGVAAANGQFAKAQLTRHGSDASGNPVTSTLTATVLSGLNRPIPPATPDAGRSFVAPGVATSPSDHHPTAHDDAGQAEPFGPGPHRVPDPPGPGPA